MAGWATGRIPDRSTAKTASAVTTTARSATAAKWVGSGVQVSATQAAARPSSRPGIVPETTAGPGAKARQPTASPPARRSAMAPASRPAGESEASARRRASRARQ